MTEDKARELAKRFGVRMCDENGDTHDEELYCFGLDDIIEMAKALAQTGQSDLDAICQDLQEKTYNQAMRIAELEAKLVQPEQEPACFVYPEFFGRLKIAGSATAYLTNGKNGEYPDGVERICLFRAQPQFKEPEQEPNFFNLTVKVRGTNQMLDITGLYKDTVFVDLPPQRTWVGLSEEDREQHRDSWRSNIHDQEIKAIEAKLKEKNT